MEATQVIKRVFLTAAVTFTAFVYILYLAKDVVAPGSTETLQLSFLNGSLLFGAFLGLTGAFTDSLKLSGAVKRLIHFVITAVNFVVTMLLISGYLKGGESEKSPYNVPARLVITLILFVVIYWIAAGIGALVKNLRAKRGSDKSDYKPMISK